MLALEIEARRAHPEILELCEEDARWRTLRFALGARWFSLFRCREPMLRMRSRTFPGFTLHYGNPILIPPSTVSSIGTLSYQNPRDPFADAPDALLEEAAQALGLA